MSTQHLSTVNELSKMLNFDRRTVQSRLFIGKVFHEDERNGIRYYSTAKACEAIYRVEFGR